MLLVRIHQNFCSSAIPAVTKASVDTSTTFTFSTNIFNHHLFLAISTSFTRYSGCDKIDLQYYCVAYSNDY